MPERPNQLKILLSDEEQEWLRALAERQGQNVSDYIRQFIRREYASASPPPKTKKR